MAQHKELSTALVFKGGTVLKKNYFENYRFSEDLDFILLDNAVTNEQIFDWFRESFEYVREEANIPLEILNNNEHEDGGINFYIGYVEPLGGQGNNKKVKVGISRSEVLEFEPIPRPVFIEYSDQNWPNRRLPANHSENRISGHQVCIKNFYTSRDDFYTFF